MSDPRVEAQPLFLRPLSQEYRGYSEPEAISSEKSSMFVNSIIVEFASGKQDVESTVHRTLTGIDPNLSVFHFASYDSQLANNFNQERLIARPTSLFGVLALILASVGIYGVMSYLVARRTSEIGIRMALGGTRSNVVAMVLRGVLWQILIGLGLGIPAASFSGHLMESQLFGVGGYDPLTLGGAALTLALCAGAAGLIPARRAASIDPMQALRTE